MARREASLQNKAYLYTTALKALEGKHRTDPEAMRAVRILQELRDDLVSQKGPSSKVYIPKPHALSGHYPKFGKIDHALVTRALRANTSPEERLRVWKRIASQRQEFYPGHSNPDIPHEMQGLFRSAQIALPLARGREPAYLGKPGMVPHMHTRTSGSFLSHTEAFGAKPGMRQQTPTGTGRRGRPLQLNEHYSIASTVAETGRRLAPIKAIKQGINLLQIPAAAALLAKWGMRPAVIAGTVAAGMAAQKYIPPLLAQQAGKRAAQEGRVYDANELALLAQLHGNEYVKGYLSRKHQLEQAAAKAQGPSAAAGVQNYDLYGDALLGWQKFKRWWAKEAEPMVVRNLTLSALNQVGQHIPLPPIEVDHIPVQRAQGLDKRFTGITSTGLMMMRRQLADKMATAETEALSRALDKAITAIDTEVAARAALNRAVT